MEGFDRVIAGGLPRVSLVLAVRNEARVLPDCCTALAALHYPADRLELVVADGGSTDGTRRLLAGLAAAAPFPVFFVDNPKGFAASGFNAGLRAASGDVIIILGARARPLPEFVAASVLALQRSGAGAVGGVVENLARGRQAGAVALALGSPFGGGGARYRFSTRAGTVDTINYGAYRRALFERFGGFDETMTNVEDDELNYRIRANGETLYLDPSIRCRYEPRGSLLGLLRQYSRYGYPKVRVLRRHPRQMQPRQFGPAAFVLALLTSSALAAWWRPARLVPAGVGGLYAAINGAVSVGIASRCGWRYLPLLPAAFAAMHLGYGVASLAGVLRFLIWPWLRGREEPSCVPVIRRPSATAEGGG